MNPPHACAHTHAHVRFGNKSKNYKKKYENITDVSFSSINENYISKDCSYVLNSLGQLIK
jgi:hypothetical protein